jgi:regulator of protease activity HflC (stomatin/prohibitin superfamily)
VELEMPGLFFILFIAIALIVIAARTFIIVKEGEGIAVFRLGRFLRVSSPDSS